MCHPPNIILIGPRGCGKTAVGRQLAARLECPFVDLDDAVLASLGAGSVTEVFEQQGEPAWRHAEARVLRDVLLPSGQVVALGGGTVMIDEARSLIEQEQSRGRATVVYLKTDPEVLIQRLTLAVGDRPSLTGADPVSEITAVLAEREQTYIEVADETCRTDSLSPDAIAEQLSAR